MSLYEASLYLDRLHELADSLQMESLAAAIDAASDAEPNAQAAQIRSACLSISKYLTRPPSPIHGSAESWQRFASILRQLELMNRREMADFDRAAAAACEAARQKIESLPLLWQRAAIRSIADFRLSPADLSSPAPDPSSRLHRQLMEAFRNASASLARELYASLLPALLEELGKSLALFLTCDELVRAVQQKPSTGEMTGMLLDRATRLEEQLLEQVGVYSEPAAETEPPFPLLLELTTILQAPIAPALRKFRVDVPGKPAAPGADRSNAFRQASLAATFALIDEAWEIQRAVTVQHVFNFISGRYTVFKLEIDAWFADQHTLLAETSGIIASGGLQNDAIRFEVEAIALRAEALSQAK
ncbi:hypothetical protein [Granulicella sibirica]|uniref:Uncharacterized protein n=1 Tax=Granulicella sibirica TaxID=2479048 RepID=A0A4Q0STD3_9BACT|nr:hypothetical protein [Granulicella sibirica]RXH54213.1 hypothetical protein GRAN_4864 [Granulicella sibirica]